MKKLFCILLSLVLIMSLASCGSASKNAAGADRGFDSDMAAFPSAKSEESSLSAESTENLASSQAFKQRKLVKHSKMDLQTKDFDNALKEIISSIEKMGGYIESQEISGRNLYNSGVNERYASINARIPTEKLNEAENKISELFNVTNRSSYIDDITDSYFDTDARLNSAKLKEERLLELLEKAESMEDIITIESKLSDVRYEIESLTAALAKMDKQVSFSYLNLNVHEVIEYDKLEKNFGQRMLGTFKRAGNNISSWAVDCFAFIIEDLPIIILNLSAFAFIVYVSVTILKKTGIWDKFKQLFSKKEK